jgi:phospholipid-translocating ATPase
MDPQRRTKGLSRRSAAERILRLGTQSLGENGSSERIHETGAVTETTGALSGARSRRAPGTATSWQGPRAGRYLPPGVDVDGLGALPHESLSPLTVEKTALETPTPADLKQNGALAFANDEQVSINLPEKNEPSGDPGPEAYSKASTLQTLRQRWFVKAPPRPRTIYLESGTTNPSKRRFPDNAVRNSKYNALTFFPRALYEEFRMFYNIFFLLIAISQLIPALRVGYLVTYIGPLAFVLAVSMSKSAVDDILRRRRDHEVNRQVYEKLVAGGNGAVERRTTRACDLRVGDLIVLSKDQRVPADCILMRASPDPNGTVFLRTDHLDGETDWKLRRAAHSTQLLPSDESLVGLQASVWAEAPRKEIYEFHGNLYLQNGTIEPLGLENTLWASTVLASGNAIALVIYTGAETRSMMNMTEPPSKVGLLDEEINFLSKLLFLLLFSMAFILLCFKGFGRHWFLYLLRYLLLLASIIPISMRINLDLAKYVYKFVIERDHAMPGAVVRNSDIPEELGRLDFILTDKTGTLTKNEMVFKKIHFGSMLFGREAMDDLKTYVERAFDGGKESLDREIRESMLAIALAHNVTPVDNDFQAASPDEVALVQFANATGVQLIEHTPTRIRLRVPGGGIATFEILVEFPFTSVAKRMGIVVHGPQEPNVPIPRRIMFFVKGADSIIGRMVRANDWLDEECGNMAREGLRTLVYAMRYLTEPEYREFAELYGAARARTQGRTEAMAAAQARLERDLKLLCITGVEDTLQDGVKATLEQLRQAEFHIWMLTGDKVETAKCIGTSSRLVGRNQRTFTISGVESRTVASRQLAQFKRRQNEVLVIDGTTLDVMLHHFPEDFIQVAGKAPAVIACRCSPTQKGELARLIRRHLGKRVLAIGDGGNDVAMIRRANVGVGIPGKEGRQASMAADFSVAQFSHLPRLLVWHGRNCYKRSACLAQFVIHRGLMIAVIQMCFSAFFYFAAVSVFNGLLMVGYATIFTMLPIFSLILDRDVRDTIAMAYPELYSELRRGRSLNVRTFLTWVLKGFYSGTAIMTFAVLVLWNDDFFTTANIQAVAFTALIILELLMVASEIHTWHYLMLLSEALSLLFYALAIFILTQEFNRRLVFSVGFIWKTAVIVIVAWLPIELAKRIDRCLRPPRYLKVGEAPASTA